MSTVEQFGHPATAGAPSVRAELLDCVQSTLAVLADRFHGPGSHLALGAELRFAPARGEHGFPTVEPEPDHQLSSAVPALGLTVLADRLRPRVGDLRGLTEEHGALYVLADSYWMPWLPYHLRAHMEHSFLLEPDGARAVVTDAYQNQTQWGPASPGRWELSWDGLPEPSRVLALAPADGGRPEPVRRIEIGPCDDYLAAYAGHPERLAALNRLAVETWLLTRSRKLHAAFAVTASVPAVEAHLRRWDQIATRAFVALRRVQLGKPEPEGLLAELGAALASDSEIFGHSAP